MSRPSLLQIFLVALRLGCTSFGGPVAHLAYFREEYVRRRRWLDEDQYADLVALCQFLPGPASSQTGFGVGYLQRGFTGGLAAWTGFTLPSALLMIGFALGLAAWGGATNLGWLHGLKAAAVAVVAQAVWQMWRNLCPDLPRSLLAVGSAAFLLWLPHAGSQLAVIAAGAALGLAGCIPVTPAAPAPAAATPRHARAAGLGCLAGFALLLVVLPVLARTTAIPLLEIADKFYRAGSLVFGGGHVVLPLLEREVVPPGWVTPDQFLAGYGAAQAMPGPLFSFSGYLGALLPRGPGGVAGGVWALLAIFLPALLLVAGALPFWQALRHQPRARTALAGANAAVVGLLLAALIHPVGTAGITDLRGAGLVLATWLVLHRAWLPVSGVVVLAAMAGALLWP